MTLEERQTLIEKGNERGDEWGTLVVGRLETMIDLPAEEACYHTRCHTAFMSGRSPPVSKKQVRHSRIY